MLRRAAPCLLLVPVRTLRRRHCANKLQSLYKLLKMQHGRTKYIKRKLEVNSLTDARWGGGGLRGGGRGTCVAPKQSGCLSWLRQ